jgi:hypothetical protein
MSWHVKLFPSVILLIIFKFDPKKEIGKVRLIKDPMVKHLKFPFNIRCRSLNSSNNPRI